MALLELKDIGKIYVSDNTVAVGIRGVNLSFDRGEFVAITGQSGSGKSTLLNVISGMDSFEEGEMYINGEETSPYIQADWEKYREKYISFIFQEYNIIDSFTVLENVELSLLDIEDPKERRRRAKDLLKRVGLEKFLHHKGSHLSGGQKQRTVIARALAKDSPIILADEPTGNLDSKTSKEIIALLREVSKDKLLIVVTHNFEEVEDYATREIRVYDGAIATDRCIREKNEVPDDSPVAKTTRRSKGRSFANGLKLGLSIFRAKPKLTLFMTVLVFVASTTIFFSYAAFWKQARTLFVDENYMFNTMPGRMVIVKRDKSALTDEEVEALKEKTGAKDALHFDYGFDRATLGQWRRDMETNEMYSGAEAINYVYGKDYGKLDIGRYPEKDNEIVLRMPYFTKKMYGEKELNRTKYYLRNMNLALDIVGVSYYFDAQIQGEILFTKSGFEKYSAMLYYDDKMNIFARFSYPSGEAVKIRNFKLSPYIPEDIIYFRDRDYEEELQYLEICFLDAKDYEGQDVLFTASLKDYKTKFDDVTSDYSAADIFLNPVTLAKNILSYEAEHYRQASLFYENKSQMKKAEKMLQDMGYYVISQGMTYIDPSGMGLVDMVMLGALFLALWIVLTLFLVFFLRICTKKSMDAFLPDIAIMRSMGIRVQEIKIAIYVRMMLCIIPSMILIPLLAGRLYYLEFAQLNLVYIRTMQYLLLFTLVGFIVMKVTQKHILHLFSENVRKALKGGDEA